LSNILITVAFLFQLKALVVLTRAKITASAKKLDCMQVNSRANALLVPMECSVNVGDALLCQLFVSSVKQFNFSAHVTLYNYCK